MRGEIQNVVPNAIARGLCAMALLCAARAFAWCDVNGHNYSDVFVPAERCKEIETAFRKLPRPIDYRQIEFHNQFCSTYSFKLRSRWKDFADRLTMQEALFALWPLLDDPECDAEASVIMIARLGLKHTNGYIYKEGFENRHPKVWGTEGDVAIGECKHICRQALGVGAFWEPHDIVFDFDSVVKSTDRNAAIETLRGIITDESIVRNNPQEIRRALEAVSLLKAAELSDELVDLFFYDRVTGQDFRLMDTKRFHSFWKYKSGPEKWKEHPDWTPAFPDITVPAILARVAGTNAVTKVLKRFSETTDAEMADGIGGGFAEAIVIRYFMEPCLRLTQEKSLEFVDLLLSEMASDEERRMRLRQLRSSLAEGKYQVTDDSVNRGWFGQMPFDYRILLNGDVLIGRQIRERFFTVSSLPGWIGTISENAMKKHPPEKRMEYPPKDAGINQYYYLSASRLKTEEVALFYDYMKDTIKYFGDDLSPPEMRPRGRQFFYEIEYAHSCD